jgi:2-dehydropantoate 2-reductase
MHETINIIGAGAIGSVLAVSLRLHGKKVVLYKCRSSQKLDEKRTINVIINDKTLSSDINVKSLEHFIPSEGILVFTNKSFVNSSLAKLLSSKKHLTSVILQNGLDVERAFVEEGFTDLYRAVLFATSQEIAENTYKFKLVTHSPIGAYFAHNLNTHLLVESLDTPLFCFRTESDIEHFVWKKTIINAVFNSVCPSLEIDNGVFYRSDEALELAKVIINECILLAHKAGINLSETDVLENLLLISKLSEGQLISTYQDILNKRETELESLNFALYKRAKNLGMELSLSKTKLLGDLALLKSKIKQ